MNNNLAAKIEQEAKELAWQASLYFESGKDKDMKRRSEAALEMSFDRLQALMQEV